MSRYLVTGAAGFIGVHLCNYLNSLGHEVWALLRLEREGPWQKAFCCELGDVPVPEQVMEGVDGVFHLANVAHTEFADEQCESYTRVNVFGTRSLLKVATEAGVSRFIYFSSVKAVKAPGHECVDETWTYPAEDGYGRSKMQAEQLVLRAGERFGMHVCILRPTLVYGPSVKGNLELMLRAIQRGRFPPFPELCDRRSMVSVEDLVKAAWLAMTSVKASGRTYIVADGVEYSTRSIYEAMCSALGIQIPKWHIPVWGLRFGALVGDWADILDIKRTPFNSAVLSRLVGSACYTAERIEDELGWRPEQTFYDMLPEMVRVIKTSRH